MHVAKLPLLLSLSLLTQAASIPGSPAAHALAPRGTAPVSPFEGAEPFADDTELTFPILPGPPGSRPRPVDTSTRPLSPSVPLPDTPTPPAPPEVRPGAGSSGPQSFPLPESGGPVGAQPDSPGGHAGPVDFSYPTFRTDKYTAQAEPGEKVPARSLIMLLHGVIEEALTQADDRTPNRATSPRYLAVVPGSDLTLRLRFHDKFNGPFTRLDLAQLCNILLREVARRGNYALMTGKMIPKSSEPFPEPGSVMENGQQLTSDTGVRVTWQIARKTEKDVARWW